MEKWEYLVGVQLNRPKEPAEVSLGGRELIESHTPPEEWLNEKGGEGWELVVAIHRGDYTEFFMKRRAGSVESEKAQSAAELDRQLIELAKEAEHHFSRNGFEQALSKLKEPQKITGTE